jgi:hypothetical protein
VRSYAQYSKQTATGRRQQTAASELFIEEGSHDVAEGDASAVLLEQCVVRARRLKCPPYVSDSDDELGVCR